MAQICRFTHSETQFVIATGNPPSLMPIRTDFQSLTYLELPGRQRDLCSCPQSEMTSRWRMVDLSLRCGSSCCHSSSSQPRRTGNMGPSLVLQPRSSLERTERPGAAQDGPPLLVSTAKGFIRDRGGNPKPRGGEKKWRSQRSERPEAEPVTTHSEPSARRNLCNHQ